MVKLNGFSSVSLVENESVPLLAPLAPESRRTVKVVDFPSPTRPAGASINENPPGREMPPTSRVFLPSLRMTKVRVGEAAFWVVLPKSTFPVLSARDWPPNRTVISGTLLFLFLFLPLPLPLLLLPELPSSSSSSSSSSSRSSSSSSSSSSPPFLKASTTDSSRGAVVLRKEKSIPLRSRRDSSWSRVGNTSALRGDVGIFTSGTPGANLPRPTRSWRIVLPGMDAVGQRLIPGISQTFGGVLHKVG